MIDAWDPDQYAKFRDERRQPFRDLLELVTPVPGGRAVDLGCGTGELTRELHEAKGFAVTVGIDNSETMLERAQAHAGGGVRFKLGTFLRFAPQKPVDVVFSNAALQWAPAHERLFAMLAMGITNGGQIAVQMPANHDHPSHAIADAVASEEPFVSALEGYRREWPVQAPEWYAVLLHGLGFVDVRVRMQVYAHLLASRDEVVEWMRGTYLTPYRSRMSPETFTAFVDRYGDALRDGLPDEQPFLYTYKRILMHGWKGSGAGG